MIMMRPVVQQRFVHRGGRPWVYTPPTKSPNTWPIGRPPRCGPQHWEWTVTTYTIGALYYRQSALHTSAPKFASDETRKVGTTGTPLRERFVFALPKTKFRVGFSVA